MEERTSAGAVVWLTGLSGSGKSTLAVGAARMLDSLGLPNSVIDGDVLRHTTCRDLGFSDADRRENIRRAGEAALAQAIAGKVALVALISPFEGAREQVRRRCAEEGVPFGLIHVNASLATCEQRDPKGLYKRARAGEIPAFTGISSPYELPRAPTLVIHTDGETAPQSVSRVVDLSMRLVALDPSFWVAL